LKEQLEEKKEKEEKLKLQFKQVYDQLASMKKQRENEKAALEQIDELKRKFLKDTSKCNARLTSCAALMTTLDKSKKKLQNDYAYLSVEFDK
jgi:chromosome segregation ATPase